MDGYSCTENLLDESKSDEISQFVEDYRQRIMRFVAIEGTERPRFLSFAKRGLSISDKKWLRDNESRFYKDTANEDLVKHYYLSEQGAITCMVFSTDGNEILVGHSSGLIQVPFLI